MTACKYLEMSRLPSFSVKSELVSEVDENTLQQWVVAFCIIRFDLEQGQLIEECYPPGCLTQNEELEVAFSSFPDSVSQHHNRSSIHDCIFFFRIRRHEKPLVPNIASSKNNEKDGSLISQGPTYVDAQKGKSHNYNSRYLYGFVFNRQRHDDRLKRGGEQKSVVILSHSPYSSVFRPLLQIMGPLYFDIGKKALTHVANCVSMWPTPVPGNLLVLPIGNASLKVNLPPSHSLPSDSGFFEDSASSLAPLLPSDLSIPQGLFHDSDLFGTFRGLLMHLWKLWEILLIGEPILIIAPTPPQCCEAVAGLVSLVAPLLFSVDFRPYFTIHDPEFSILNSLPQGSPYPPMVLGVTNLFFLKALGNMPHIVSVGTPVSNSSRLNIGSRALNGEIHTEEERLNSQHLLSRKFITTNLLNAVKLKRDGPLCLMTEHKEAVWSNYASVTKPDTSILNRLVDAGLSPRVEESMSVVNNDILRRHFLELTTNFLAPFGPYFRANTPSEASSPYINPPSLPPFSTEEFLSTLSERGPGKFLLKRMRSNWLDLYRRFLKGQNFLPWFRRKRAVAEQEQYKMWRQARIRSNINQLMVQMSELEIVDSFHAIERNLQGELQCGKENEDTEDVCKKLKKDLQIVFKVLPEDLQQLLIMNPDRASLLRESVECSERSEHSLPVDAGVFSAESR